MKLSSLVFLLFVIFSQTMYCAYREHNNQFPEDRELQNLLASYKFMDRKSHLLICKKYLKGLKERLEKVLQARNVIIRRYETK